MEEYIGVRQMLKEGLSVREMSRKTGYHRETINKMILLGAPPGYQEPQRPILGPFTGVIDEMLSSEQKVHKKQRHTAKRIFDRLKGEYGYAGGYTQVKDVEPFPRYKRWFTLLLDRLMVGFNEPIHYWPRQDLTQLLAENGLRVYSHAILDTLPHPHIIYICKKPNAEG